MNTFFILNKTGWVKYVCVVAELFSDVQETSDIAYSVSDSDGVCFVPSFSGLQVHVYEYNMHLNISVQSYLFLYTIGILV